MDAFWETPPVTRALVTLTFAQSALVFARVLNPYYVFFSPEFIFKLPPQIWRLCTTFMMTGPKYSFFFDLYHMYKFGSALEKESPRFTGPGDFFTYVVFVGTFLLLAAGYYMEYFFLTRALIMAFLYTYAQDNRGKKTKFWFIPLQVEYLPWMFLVFDLVVSGPGAAILGFIGIIAAHLYEFLTRIYPEFGGGRNYIVTPGFVRRYFARGSSRGAYRSYGTAFRPAQDSSGDSWSSSVQGSWSARGRGRRLGGD